MSLYRELNPFKLVARPTPQSEPVVNFKVPMRAVDRPSRMYQFQHRAYLKSIEIEAVAAWDLLQSPQDLHNLVLSLLEARRDLASYVSQDHNRAITTTYSRGKIVPRINRSHFDPPDRSDNNDSYITVEQRNALTDELIGFRHFKLEGIPSEPKLVNAEDVIRIAVKEAKDGLLTIMEKKTSELLAQSDEVHKLSQKSEAQIAAREKQLQLEIERLNEQKREFEAARVTKTECPYADELVKVFKPTDEIMNSPCVYLLYAGGRFKIGYTKCLDKRLMQLQTGTPYPIDIVCVLITNNPQGLEWELHKRFAEQRVYGEWFTLTDDDVRYIHALAEAA